ncbi:MAG: hypothetical protein FJW31_20405 [Acidobacteria bacterium]|nr:hypothetical protein [Acidobacteriota bacterium]
MRCLRVIAALLASATVGGAAELDQLAWLSGKWKGPVGKSESEEHWMAPAGNIMLGMNRTTAGGRVVAFEYLRIFARGGDLFYVAQPGGKAPTEFKLTQSEARAVVFENPAHDFPQRIEYRLETDGKALVAVVSGVNNGKAGRLEFRFQKIDEPSR